MQPKYKVDDKIKFKLNNEDEKEGIVYVVDKWGTFENDTDVSYDILVESENCLYKHIPQYECYKDDEFDIKIWFCNKIYDFVKEHEDDISISIEQCGAKDFNDLLNQIKNDLSAAGWAFTQLMDWGMRRNNPINNYHNTFLVVNEEGIYHMDEIYFELIYEEYDVVDIHQLRKVKKMIEVFEVM